MIGSSELVDDPGLPGLLKKLKDFPIGENTKNWFLTLKKNEWSISRRLKIIQFIQINQYKTINYKLVRCNN